MTNTVCFLVDIALHQQSSRIAHARISPVISLVWTSYQMKRQSLSSSFEGIQIRYQIWIGLPVTAIAASFSASAWVGWAWQV